MRIVHESADGDRSVLATDVETADSTLAQMVGLRFRHEIPDDFALVFDFAGTRRGLTDMLFVYVPLDVVWLRDGEVVRVETLAPWRGLAYVTSDAMVEFPAGTAADVAPGDRLLFEDEAAPAGNDAAGTDTPDAAGDTANTGAEPDAAGSTPDADSREN